MTVPSTPCAEGEHEVSIGIESLDIGKFDQARTHILLRLISTMSWIAAAISAI
jgi:hypothetical protein